MKKWILLILITVILASNIAVALRECQTPMQGEDIPCLLISPWVFPKACNTYTINIYQSNTTLLNTVTMGDLGILNKCNITWNYTTVGSYILNWSSGDSSKIIVEEDSNMILGLIIGIGLIVCLFIFLTFAVKEDKPFLAHFFFLGIFIFTTVLSNLLWKVTSVNSSPYEPIMLVVYRMILIITMLMSFIVLLMLTIESVKVRRVEGNPVDAYRDNLRENE